MSVSRYARISHCTAALSDSRNCSVIALSIACRVPYNVSAEACGDQGRKKNRGLHTGNILKAAEALGCQLVKVHNKGTSFLRQKNGSQYTNKTIGKRCKQGYYLVFVKGHVLAVVNGEVEDWSKATNRRVLSAYRVIVPAGSRS